MYKCTSVHSPLVSSKCVHITVVWCRSLCLTPVRCLGRPWEIRSGLYWRRYYQAKTEIRRLHKLKLRLSSPKTKMRRWDKLKLKLAQKNWLPSQKSSEYFKGRPPPRRENLKLVRGLATSLSRRFGAAGLVPRKFDLVTCKVSGVFDTHEYVVCLLCCTTLFTLYAVITCSSCHCAHSILILQVLNWHHFCRKR